ncbi:ParB N-terminal domain-containing protein [Sulfitobacter sp. JBTF-M27]|uniref:Methyltransferase n=1 Tax=Sulfitobacter sediminilitoris TaxID=2698830 RepID=A0A6P0CDG5_9RHOB|nr:DNA methyltransferase [Sulfitobacter sediminilitoris]NEK23917.1 ParB N-terminal domain-containing protein [Sulfitobacter sediminilitoris]
MSADFETIALRDITPASRNARTHSKKQIRQIAKSIRQFGFTNPVLVDERTVLIAGHGRLEAARLLGLTTVPAIRVTHLSAEEKRALMLADNKIAENAGWDLEILATELADLSEAVLDFDLEITAFEIGEIDVILRDHSSTTEAAPETAPIPDDGVHAITRRGDLWHLDRHRVLCGDARDVLDYAALMGDKKASMGITDPPYNVPIAGHVCGNGRVQHREFVEASGEMSPDTFEAFLTQALQLGATYSEDGAVWFAFMDWRHLGEMHRAGTTAFDAMINLCVWAKTNAGMGSLYRSQHELVLVFRKGRKQHRNNVQLGKFGRHRSNLWTYPGVNTFRPGRMTELEAHPTPKPVALIREAILDVSKRGDIVLDPFLGGGATVIAAEEVGRVAYGLEIDPLYVDVILRRWRVETGREPVRASDGWTLGALEREAGQEGGE